MRIVAAILALTVSGCSLMFTRGPEPGPYQSEPQCSTSSAPAVLDFGGTLFWLLAIATAESLSGLPGGDEKENRSKMIMFGGFAALHLVSIGVGSRRVSRCKEARDAWRRSTQPAMPAPTPAPAAP